MKCPRCKHEWKLPGPQTGGRNSKRKITPEQQSRMQAAKKRKAGELDMPNDQAQPPKVG